MFKKIAFLIVLLYKMIYENPINRVYFYYNFRNAVILEII